MQSELAFGLGFVVFALMAAVGCVFLLAGLQDQLRGRPQKVFPPEEEGILFLFDGEDLVDATAPARLLMAGALASGRAWSRLMSVLSDDFPLIATQIADLPALGIVEVGSTRPGRQALNLRAELRGGLVHIRLSDGPPVSCGTDSMVQRAQQDELAGLREAVDQAPLLIWREDGNNRVAWANSPYLSRITEAAGAESGFGWPLPRLFDLKERPDTAPGQRHRLILDDGSTAWYEVFAHPSATGKLCFARPVDAAVQAETTLHDFMQTLAKTFAHLPIGLAIFDSRRKLQLFNPALLDLTGLQPDFLSMRPSIVAVLDALRDLSMIPEPKDYRSWRQDLIAMEKAAASGLYEETWSLPGGQTFRVSGRPHPNGALALMIEDISGEMLRTRRFRADLELGQSVIDAMSEAIAVYSAQGHLVMSNLAFAALWGSDPMETLSERTICQSCEQWRSQSAPSALWSDVEDFVVTVGERSGWQAEVRLLDGRLLGCRFAPLSGGATLIGFSPVSSGRTRSNPRRETSQTLVGRRSA